MPSCWNHLSSPLPGVRSLPNGRLPPGYLGGGACNDTRPMRLPTCPGFLVIPQQATEHPVPNPLHRKVPFAACAMARSGAGGAVAATLPAGSPLSFAAAAGGGGGPPPGDGRVGPGGVAAARRSPSRPDIRTVPHLALFGFQARDVSLCYSYFVTSHNFHVAIFFGIITLFSKFLALPNLTAIPLIHFLINSSRLSYCPAYHPHFSVSICPPCHRN